MCDFEPTIFMAFMADVVATALVLIVGALFLARPQHPEWNDP